MIFQLWKDLERKIFKLFALFKLATRQWPESRQTLKYLYNLYKCWNMFLNVKWNVRFHIWMVSVSWSLSNFLNSDFCRRAFFSSFCEHTKLHKLTVGLKQHYLNFCPIRRSQTTKVWNIPVHILEHISALIKVEKVL